VAKYPGDGPGRRYGRVVDAPWLAPARVEFELHDWWHGCRTVTVDVDPGEVAVLR
jgi:hypothetical protein